MPKQPLAPFNLLLNPEDKTMLDTLADRLSVSRGQVLRQALRQEFTMRIKKVPLCATGQPCFVPQMHALTAAADKGTEDSHA